ncbi:MAG: hypothetical protein PHV60_10170 [bacterium]|nr:hypothetical protein [bacterium]
MIWIVSILIAISLILSSVFINFAPSFHNIIEKDFQRKARNNAVLSGLQYGNLLLRAGTIDPTASDINKRRRKITDTLVKKNGAQLKQVDTTITFSRVTASTPECNISVDVDIK